MSYLELAKRLAADLEQDESAPHGNGQIVQIREEVGAGLIASPRYGEVWIALTPGMAAELRAEEAQRSEPRPVLLPDDIAALRGKSEAAICAALEVARAFPGARVIQ